MKRSDFLDAARSAHAALRDILADQPWWRRILLALFLVLVCVVYAVWALLVLVSEKLRSPRKP